MSFRVFHDVLPSALTCVTVEAPHLHSVMCAVYVRVGSRHEQARTNGVSHLLEHLFFRGSRRYPDSVQMNALVEAVGGNLNGVTMRDSSSFFTPCHPDGLPVALDVLGDMLTQPRLVHLATEKKIVLEEMLDEVDERGRDIDVDNLSKRQTWGDHPLAFKIAGTPTTVKRLTLADVRRHFERFYVGGNLVLGVAGPVTHARVLALARKAVGRVPSGPRNLEAPPPPPQRAVFHFTRLEESQVELRLTFPAVSDHHPDAMPLALLRRVLDDGLSSRLPHNIVERRGLAYSIGATIETFHDAGAFEIDGACAPEHAGPVVREVLRTLATLRQGRITPEELRRAQRRLHMQLDFSQDAPADLCGWFAGTELFRRAESFDEKKAQASAVTVDDLVAVSRRYLEPSRLVTVAVGPQAAKRPMAEVIADAARLLGR
ncbi:MAG: insulinase family protein [Myxococcaceae bacterium]|nr:insulinase family protein [Myxococcaceae bacterium]